MSTKGMGDIDELLAKITGEKQSHPTADSNEIDNILKSFGKSAGTKAPNLSDIRPASVPQKKAPSDNAAKSADTLFCSFFDDAQQGSAALGKKVKKAVANTASLPMQPHAALYEEKSKAVPSEKNGARFSGDIFADTFTAKQEPSTKAESKKRIKKDLPITSSLPIQPTPAPIQAAPLVRQIDEPPSAGSLREKILSAAKNSAFQTEEDEEYFATDVTDDNKKAAVPKEMQADNSPLMKAYAEFAGEDKPQPQEAKGHNEKPFEEETPTLEFPVQGAKGVKAKMPTVLRPDTEGEIPVEPIVPRRSQNIMMSEVDDTFREFFGETVAVSRAEIDEGLRKKPRAKLIERLFPQADDEDDENEDEPNDDIIEQADDYNFPSDAPEVEATLSSMRVTATLRVGATSLVCAMLLYLGLSARTGLLPAIPVLNPTNEPLLYLVANLALLLISGLVCLPTIIGGFVSMFKEASSDILSFACFSGAFLQTLAYLIKPTEFDPLKITLFAPVAAAALCASAIGKRIQCTTVCRNFETLSVGYEHSAAYLLKNREVAAKVCRELNDDEPALLISRPTTLVKGFLQQSFSQFKHARATRIFGFVIIGFSFLAFIFTYVQTKSFFSALTAFAAVCALCAPFSATLLHAVPASLMQKSTARVGAIVPGWSAIEALGKANAVMVNAKDLFPRENIHLHGIKTFEKERIDLAILYAASILVEGCDTLRDIFLAVIENKTEMLYKVDSLAVDPGYGFTAWVEHQRVIVGNRAIMQKHDIALPSLDYELKYTKGERCPVYLAVAGKLFGMFLVSYTPSDEADEVLFGLTHSGVSVVIKSDDFNLTSDMLAQLYGLNRSQVKVLNASERDALAPLTAYLPESEGILTHLGTLPSFAGGLRAASGAQGGLKLSFILQLASIILGILLCLLLLFSKSLLSISLTAVILFQLAWTALAVIVPFTKRY